MRDRPRVATPIHLLAFGLLFAAWPMPVAAQSTVVAPNANTASEGNSNNYFPLLTSGGMRYQQVYDATQFSVFGGPQLINQITFRNDTDFGETFSANIANIQISLSTIALAPDSLSSTFADNIGADNAVVFNGSLTVSSTDGAGAGDTRVFDVVINFQTPFQYNPALGNLLLDILNISGADDFVAGSFFDAVDDPSDSVSRVWGNEGNPFDTEGSLDTFGLVTQFGFVAVPEPTTWALIGVCTVGAGAYAWNKRRHGKSQWTAKLK